MNLSKATILRLLGVLCITMAGACAAPAGGSTASGEPGLDSAVRTDIPAAESETETETGNAPGRDQEVVVVMPAQPRPLAEVAPTFEPAAPRTEDGERLGSTSQALYTYTGGAADPSYAGLTLYVVDGSGSGAGSYPVTSSIYGRFAGKKYYVQGPGTFLQESREILTNLASKMYWDCWNGNRDAVLAGYSRGPYYTLEAHRWASVWGCAPNVRAALFVDPVDTLVWGFNHTVPGAADVGIVRKNVWYNLWATIFSNGAIWGGTRYVRDVALSHPAIGSSQLVADEEVAYGRSFLGSGAFY